MNKAFTLVELLGTIVVLGIIGMITTPIVQNEIDKNNTKTCKYQIESFKRAAKNYIASNPFKNINEETTIKIGELIDDGYIEDSELKNPKGGKFSINSSVKITYDGKKTTYTYEKADEEKECED